MKSQQFNAISIFLCRVAVLAVPVYVVAVLVWKFALHQSWLPSLAGVPLGLFIGGVVYSLVTSLVISKRKVLG